MIEFNEIDLRKILRNAKPGLQLWSTAFGNVRLCKVGRESNNAVEVETEGGFHHTFYSDGRFFPEGECLLFPSRNQRNWSKFQLPERPHHFKPFERVLVRDEDRHQWIATLFSSYNPVGFLTASGCFSQCVPYEGNERLIGTTDSPKEGGGR